MPRRVFPSSKFFSAAHLTYPGPFDLPPADPIKICPLRKELPDPCQDTKVLHEMLKPKQY